MNDALIISSNDEIENNTDSNESIHYYIVYNMVSLGSLSESDTASIFSDTSDSSGNFTKLDINGNAQLTALETGDDGSQSIGTNIDLSIIVLCIINNEIKQPLI